MDGLAFSERHFVWRLLFDTAKNSQFIRKSGLRLVWLHHFPYSLARLLDHLFNGFLFLIRFSLSRDGAKKEKGNQLVELIKETPLVSLTMLISTTIEMTIAGKDKHK